MTAPEYDLARALIARLQQQPDLAPAVLAKPFDNEDHAAHLALAAAQYSMAVAVSPQPPASLGAEFDRTGVLQARLGVVVLTTPGVLPGAAAEKLAAASGRVLALCMGWAPEGRGIPYEAAEVLEVAQLNTAEYPDFKNLGGHVIVLGKKVNYKMYYNS